MLQAKRCLLDYLGVTLAGAQILKDKTTKLLTYLGETSGSATLIGLDRKAGIQTAALINGMNAHVAELDDGVRFGAVHPGSSVISALLPLAEKENVKGRDLLTGIIVGYEVSVRLAYSLQPSHYKRGYHPSSTCGSIGAALGIATMLKFSKSKMKDALSSAAISASGTLKVLEDGSEIKPFNVGRSALIGILSAVMSESGFSGPDDVLSGEAGFLSMMVDSSELSRLERGEDLAVEKVYVKPYSACRHAHPAIDAILKIRLTKKLCESDIKEIKVLTYRGILGKHDHTEIHGISSARMSIPYALAVALITGKAGIEEFTFEYVNNAEIVSLVKKVSVFCDDSLSALVPQKRSAKVEIITFDGDCYSEKIEHAKGEPECPLSNTELEEKFKSLSAYGRKTNEESREIIQIVWNLENRLNNLFCLL